MRVRILTLAVLAALGLTLAAPVEARPLSATITLSRTVTLGNVELEPGDYRVTADDNQVTVRRGGTVLVELPAVWKEIEVAPRSATVVLREGRIIEIRFGGQTRALSFE